MTTPDQPTPNQVASFDQTHAAWSASLDLVVDTFRAQLAEGHHRGITMAGLSTWLSATMDPGALAEHLAVAVDRLHATIRERDSLARRCAVRYEEIRQLREALDAAHAAGVAEGGRQATEGAVVEHARGYKSGDMQVRWSGAERIYPIAEWIPDQQQNGGKVYTRRVIVVDDWTEVPRAAEQDGDGR